MSEVKWIKICTDIFDDEKIILIEAMPDSYAIITAWFKLLCLAGKQNNNGVFMLNDRIAYTDEMLATIFRMPINTVRLALNTFEDFKMIETINGVVTIPNWDKHQSIERLEKLKEYQKNYHRDYRARQKQLTSGDCKQDSKVYVNGTDIDIEEDIDKEKESNNKHFIPPTVDEVNEYCRQRNNKVNAQHFVDFYESKGWMIGKNKMKNWKATIRTWESKDGKSVSKDSKTGTGKFDCIKYDV